MSPLPPTADGLPFVRPLDIIVPVYRNASITKACVDSLLLNRGEVAAHRPRIVLVNDSPDDGDVEALMLAYEKACDDMLVLRNDMNEGFLRTANRGLRLALERGSDALLVNSDTLTFAGTLAAMLRCAAADASIGFVCPRSNNASICSFPHSPPLPEVTPENAYRSWEALRDLLPPFHFAPTAVGFYCLVTHAVLSDVGLLSESFGVGYEEENELVMRARRLGYRAAIANHGFAFHRGSASFALTDLDVAPHRQRNLERIAALHPGFLPTMAAYERSPHFRAERLLAGMLPDGEGRLRIAFDLSALKARWTDLGAAASSAIAALTLRHSARLRVTVLCTPRALERLDLATVEGLRREDAGAGGLHAIAVRFGARPDLRDLVRLSELAALNFFAVADTADEDCFPDTPEVSDEFRWDRIGWYGHAWLFASGAAANGFSARFPSSIGPRRLAAFFPTGLADLGTRRTNATAAHVLVWGHGDGEECDGCVKAVERLADRLADLHFIAPGEGQAERANVTWITKDAWSPRAVERLIVDARVVVVPAHEGLFDTGLLRSLAAGRPVVARRTALHKEILEDLHSVSGVHLFDTDATLDAAFDRALQASDSRADDTEAFTWNAWADAFAAFCLEQSGGGGELFERLTRRLLLLDRMQREEATVPRPAPSPDKPESTSMIGGDARASNLDDLLALNDAAFVRNAYITLLGRPADQAGLDFYRGQLRDGVDKLEILQALAISPEGRTRDTRLAGLQERLRSRPRRAVGWIKRLLRR